MAALPNLLASSESSATPSPSESQNWGVVFSSATSDHWDTMLRFALSLAGNRPDADDLLQSSLLKALTAFPRFLHDHFEGELEALRGSAHTRNWLLKIVKNTWLDSISKRRRWSFESDEILDSIVNSDHRAQEPECSLPSEEAQFFELALDDQWKSRLKELTPRQRSVLFLSANDYSYKEIAAILGIPLGTVMSTLSRTLARLRATIPNSSRD